MFLQSLVTYDDFVENPRLIDNPDLVVKVGTKYYTWHAACPIIMSWALYQRSLPQSSIDGLVKQFQPKKREDKKTTTTTTTKVESAPVAVPQQQQIQQQQQQQQEQQRSSYSSWLPWRRSEPKAKNASGQQTPVATSAPIDMPDAKSRPVSDSTPATMQDVNQLNRGPSAMRHTSGTSSDNESDSTGPDGSKKLPLDKRPYYENTDVYCKTLRLTTEQIVRKFHGR